MSVNYQRLYEIMEKKINRAIEMMHQNKIISSEYNEALDAVYKNISMLSELKHYDNDCPHCREEEEEPVKEEIPYEPKLIGKLLPETEKEMYDRIIMFYSEGCDPCSKMKPIIERVSKETKLPLQITHMDSELSKALEVTSFPLIGFLKEGQFVEELRGHNNAISDEEAVDMIKNRIKEIYREV